MARKADHSPRPGTPTSEVPKPVPVDGEEEAISQPGPPVGSPEEAESERARLKRERQEREAEQATIKESLVNLASYGFDDRVKQQTEELHNIILDVLAGCNPILCVAALDLVKLRYLTHVAES